MIPQKFQDNHCPIKNSLERILTKQRGYVYKLPKGENVVLTMTGGIDSSVGAQLVIEKWNSVIYPFYLRRSATAERFELQAVKKVVNYLKEKYPTHIKDLFIASAPVPIKEIKSGLSRDRVIKRGHPLRNSIIQSYAVQYGTFLNDQGINLNTILVCSVVSDFFPGSREIDLITNTLYTCVNLEEWKWQILSPFLQPGLLKGKEKVKKIDLIRLGHRKKFPFELTRTCTGNTYKSCGKCAECIERLETFHKARISDPILYKR